jgi:hypothetical protein
MQCWRLGYGDQTASSSHSVTQQAVTFSLQHTSGVPNCGGTFLPAVGNIRSDVLEEDVAELALIGCVMHYCVGGRVRSGWPSVIHIFFLYNFPGIEILPPNVSTDGFKIHFVFFSTEQVTQSLQKETVADWLLRAPARCVFSRSLAMAPNSGDSSTSRVQVLYSQPPV